VKLLTRSEAETKRRKAVTFLRRIGKDDEADQFDRMDASEYAAHKGAKLLENPLRRRTSVRGRRVKTKTELAAELDEANDYIEQLESRLDGIVGIASGEEEEEDEPDEEEDDEGPGVLAAPDECDGYGDDDDQTG
jgi:hypothetical protein